MTVLCAVACAVAITSALLVVLGRNGMHALLNLIVMLLAVAVAFFSLGAPFLAALEVIIYAGAIMVLFVFVVMILNLDAGGEQRERAWLADRAIWVGPATLALVLLGVSFYVLAGTGTAPPAGAVGAREVGVVLYRDYVIAVEVASMLLLGGLVAAWHLAPALSLTAAAPSAPSPHEPVRREQPPPGGAQPPLAAPPQVIAPERPGRPDEGSR